MRSVFASDDQSFGQRLAEAMAWVAARLSLEDLETSLRSRELLPWLFERERAGMVQDVARRRVANLGARVTPVSSRHDLRGGRLLAYMPELSLSDGAAEAASRGFFDQDNAPPWDTWVALGQEPDARSVNYRSYLVSWVPDVLVPTVQRGISVNPEQCITWLEDAPIKARVELCAWLVESAPQPVG
jgi:hypothetical protein